MTNSWHNFGLTLFEYFNVNWTTEMQDRQNLCVSYAFFFSNSRICFRLDDFIESNDFQIPIVFLLRLRTDDKFCMSVEHDSESRFQLEE